MTPSDLASAIIVAFQYLGNNLMRILLISVLFYLLLSIILHYTPFTYDDSDNLTTHTRSGMKVYTDHLTRLQYLGTAEGALIPRLDPQGKQIHISE